MKVSDDQAFAFFMTRLLSDVMLNAAFVRMGWFDTLLSEMDDPKEQARWKNALLRRKLKADDGH